MTYKHETFHADSAKRLVEEIAVYYEALRRLGFTPEEIYLANGIMFRETGEICFGLVVRVDGHEDWSCSIGVCPESEDAVKAAWIALGTERTGFVSEARMQELWQTRMPIDKFHALGESLAMKGLSLRSVRSYR